MYKAPRGKPANPGANSNVVLFDTLDSPMGQQPLDGRLRITAYVDQNFTINTYWAADSQSPLRLVDSTAYATPGNAVHAAKPITAVAKASLAAGGGTNDYFTVNYTTVIDGVTTTVTKICEFKVDANFVATVGRTAIDASAATTATDVAVLMAAQIAADFPLTLSVPVPTTSTLTMTAKQSGARFAVTATENVANAGFTIGATVTGVEGPTPTTKNVVLPPGRTRCVLVTATAPTEFDVAVDTVDDGALQA